MEETIQKRGLGIEENISIMEMNKPRLIDANAWIEELKSNPGANSLDRFVNERIIYLLENRPTAYDIDEIVEKLEKAGKIYKDKAVIELSTEGHTLDYEHFKGKSKAFLNAIEIVKGGAVDDETMA